VLKLFKVNFYQADININRFEAGFVQNIRYRSIWVLTVLKSTSNDFYYNLNGENSF